MPSEGVHLTPVREAEIEEGHDRRPVVGTKTRTRDDGIGTQFGTQDSIGPQVGFEELFRVPFQNMGTSGSFHTSTIASRPAVL